MNPLSPLSLVIADCAQSVPVERAVWELATRLPRERFEVRVWLPSDAASEPLAAALATREIVVDRVPTSGAAWSFRRIFDVWSRLRRARPTVLHMHFDWPTRGGFSGPMSEMAGVRHRVLTAHGGRTPEDSRGASKTALERADAVTTTCELFGDQLVRETGISRDRVRRVPPGVDPPDEFREADAAAEVRERLGASPLRPLWVFVGRFEARRGVEVLVESLGIASSRGLPFIAVLAGEGAQRGAVERRLAELELGASVQLVGPPEDLGALLAAADVVVVPSLWDGVSGVMLQALARGRAVIASAVGGAPDFIENGLTGRLVPPGDARSLADALEFFHRRPDVAARLGREAAGRVRDECPWERVVEAYEAVYDEVLGLASFVPESDAVARGRW